MNKIRGGKQGQQRVRKRLPWNPPTVCSRVAPWKDWKAIATGEYKPEEKHEEPTAQAEAVVEAEAKSKPKKKGSAKTSEKKEAKSSSKSAGKSPKSGASRRQPVKHLQRNQPGKSEA